MRPVSTEGYSASKKLKCQALSKAPGDSTFGGGADAPSIAIGICEDAIC